MRPREHVVTTRHPRYPRASSTARGYDSAWQRLRLAILAAEPLCRTCLAERPPRITEATVVDHIETIEFAPHRRLDPSNLQPLCESCHNSKTAKQDGGFGRLKQPQGER